MNYILMLTIIAAAALGLGRVFLKLGSGVFHPVFSLFVLYAAFGVAGLALLLSNLRGIRDVFHFDRASFLFLICTALALAVFDLIAIYVFKGGGRVAIFAPVTGGGSVLVAVLVGVIFLGEKITILQFGGAILTAAGVVLLLL
ncbi:MAG: EamA family transporter [bacterium]|nr:EamA family transporter [bacterium]